MTSGERSFGVLFWWAVGMILASMLVLSEWWLLAVGIGLGLYVLMLVCNAISAEERRPSRKR